MKKIILIIILACAFASASYAQASYDSVASFTAKTTIGVTDIFPFQTKVANKYTWRKITGASMWDRITDTTEARITTLLNASNSWNGINNFDGATFNSGSHGKVLFNGDSVVVTTSIWALWLQRYSASAIIGNYNAPFFNIYARTFTIVNAYGNDSASITYDDSTLTFSKNVEIPNLTITDEFIMDSSSNFNSIIYKYKLFSIPNTGDTIMTFTTREPFVELDLPGNVTPGISRFDMSKATLGQIVRIFNGEVSYTVILKDYVGNDDNLYLSANFTMGKNDIIELMCISPTKGSQIWVEVSRSNN